MFCHLTLQGKLLQSVSAWGQLNLLAASSLSLRRPDGGGGSEQEGGTESWSETLGSFVAVFICILQNVSFFFFFPEPCQTFKGKSPALSCWGTRGVVLAGTGWCLQLNDAGTQRDYFQKLSSITIFRVTLSRALLLGFCAGIHDWCGAVLCVGRWSEKKRLRVAVLLIITNDWPVVQTPSSEKFVKFSLWTLLCGSD